MTRPPRARFALERFAWGAPDRLELAGTFTGLDEPDAPAPPVLVLSGAGHTHRLRARGRRSGAPEDGQPWRAAFVWEEPPAAFDAAVLQLGGDLAVELPEPGDADAAGRASAAPPGRCATSAPAARAVRARGRALDRARGAARGARGLHRAEEELARAREDLTAEREGRAADATRFREGVARDARRRPRRR